MRDASVVASMILAVAALVAPFLTRRTAKESATATRDLNAVTGFADLVDDLRTEREDRDRRIAMLEENAAISRRLARAHRQWDYELWRKMINDGHEIPPPPPLEAWEEQANGS